MKYLLDTHIVVWAAAGAPNMPQAALNLLNDPTTELYVSAVVFWEASIKGGAKLGITAENLHRVVEEAGFIILDVNADHAIRVGTLPNHHADPFDRMMLAQALCEGMQLVTADGKLALYGAGVYPV